MAAHNTGDDITFGQTNAGQDGTELRADANDEGGFGNDFVLQLKVSPIIIHRNAVDGLRSIAVKQGRGVFAQAEEIAGVFGSCLGSGVHDIGVRGENEWVDPPDGSNPGQGVGVLGTVQLEQGVGVRGENTAIPTPSGGSAIAVVGHSSIGTGVQGVSDRLAGGAIGVEGVANAGDGAIGVHGQANGTNATSSVGVFAESDAGMAIKANSPHGVGGVFDATVKGLVYPPPVQPQGLPPPGRAGVFGSDSAAQVYLVPHQPLKQPALNQTFAVQALITKGLAAEFPANGQAGDLLCTTMRGTPPRDVEIATLWFCEKGGTDQANPAHWRQVLLGQVFSGHG
jgi:hypothetical protein